MIASLRGLWLRIRYLLFRSRFDREMDEEMRFHLDLRAAENEHAGMTTSEAREAAQRRFGNSTNIQEDRRMAIGFPSADTLGQDLRYVLRAIRHSPGFTIMVVATLGIAIGANAAMFGIIDRLLLRGPEHIVDADRVVRLYATEKNGDFGESTGSVVGYVAYTKLRESSRAFDDLAVYARTDATVGRGAEAGRVQVGRASWNFFPLLGVKPVLGRFFTADEDRPPSGTNVVVLDEGYWKRAFAGDRGVLGRTITISGVTYTIIGVAPQGFTGAEFERRDAWVPISLTYWGPGPGWPTSWSVNWLQIIGRLKPGITMAQASADATSAHQRAYDGPANEATRTATFSVAPLRFNRRGTETTEARVSRWLIGVAAIVLLIACANVANLFLARATRRRREVAVRLALGIGRARLIRVLIAESIVLGLAGSVIGVAIAFAAGRFIRGVLLPNVEWGRTVNVRVLLVTGLAGIATGLVVGLLPALQGTRLDLTSALKSGIREGGAQRSRARTLLTVAQAALSVTLLIGAGLFVRSLGNVSRLRLGIEPDKVLTMSFDRPSIPDQSADVRRQARLRENLFYDDALARVRTLAGVQRAAVVVGTPFQSANSIALKVPGRDSIPELPGGGPYIRAISDDYFATAGTRVLKGRVFTADEVARTERLTVVNETMAKTLWPNREAIGECLTLDTIPCARVIGVVEDVRRFALREDPAMQYYIPLGLERALGFGGRRMFIRPRGDVATLTTALRSEMLRLDPGIGFVVIQSLQESLDPQIRPWRLGATMFGVFGGLALLVAAIGMYSVISYLVTQRRHELGVRIALGAQPSNIVSLVVRYGVGLALVGIAIGLLLAFNASRLIEPLLFDTPARNPAVFAIVAIVLLLVAVVASVVPAWRASRVDPIEALRTE